MRFGVHQLDERGPLRVPELAHVEVARDAVRARGADPAEQDVARRLGQALALDDAAAVVVELAAAEEGLEDRGLRLLELQDQRVVAVAPEQQRGSTPASRRSRRRRPCGPRRRTGSARAGGGGRWTASGGSSAGPCSRTRRAPRGAPSRRSSADRSDQRRVARDPRPPSTTVVSFANAFGAVLRARLVDVLLEPLLLLGRRGCAACSSSRRARCGRTTARGAHRGEALHRLAVGARHAAC